MGVKYAIEQFTDRAVAELRALFPRTLHARDAARTASGSSRRTIHGAPNLFRAMGQFPGARPVLYRCAQLDGSVLLSGTGCALKTHGARMAEECRELERAPDCIRASWCSEALSHPAFLSDDVQEKLRGEIRSTRRRSLGAWRGYAGGS